MSYKRNNSSAHTIPAVPQKEEQTVHTGSPTKIAASHPYQDSRTKIRKTVPHRSATQSIFVYTFDVSENKKNNASAWLATVKRWVVLLMPEFLMLGYHFVFAVIAVVLYSNPSRKLIVIGITGTKGKTSTASFMYFVLSAAGEKVGLISTAEVRIGDTVHINRSHMTMPGRGYVQKQLQRMVAAGCRYAIIETPSEGIRQFRVFGVWYDSLVFTNLSPEHLVTHKTFERYRQAKGRLFKQQARQRQKILGGKKVKRFIICNADDSDADYFYNLADSPLNERLLTGFGAKATVQISAGEDSERNTFSLEGEQYTVPLPGIITVRNAVPAILLAKRYCDISTERVNQALASAVLPGRLEEINEGQPFKVFCDYAHEPLSVESVYDALKGSADPHGGRVIMLVGAVGASRWRYNAVEIGKVAGRCADITIVTDIDPFFDNPYEIMDAVVSGVQENDTAEWYAEPDRKKAMRKAFSLAKKGDVVIITGKGAEVTMEVKGVSRPWDERAIIREELQHFKAHLFAS